MGEQLFQIAVKALIRDTKGEILMLHIPKWGHNPAHWDLPGGRLDSNETFLQALKRELKEEIGVSYSSTPKQLTSVLTNITIKVNDQFLPLAYVIYEVKLPLKAKISLDKDLKEDKYQWFKPKLAAQKMAIKFPQEFCELVSKM